MAEYWDTRHTRWEELFDKAVELAANRRLSATLSLIKRIRAWQHRQPRHGNENHSWHDAELSWLQGVVLERARQRTRASRIWHRLGRFLETELKSEDWFLPKCGRCAERSLGFAPNWFSVASALRTHTGDLQPLPEALSERALSPAWTIDA
jgi:hypothetical protein